MDMNYENHEAAALFPMHSKDHFGDLIESVRDNGWDSDHPIVLCEGKILDGRNRYKACLELGVEPTFVEFAGDPFAKAWLENGSRRDLDPGQRAAIRLRIDTASGEWRKRREAVAQAANRKRREAANSRPRETTGVFIASGASREAPLGKVLNKSAESLASKAGVSRATAERAQQVASRRPDLIDKVADGEMTLPNAIRELKKDEHAARVAQRGSGMKAAEGGPFELVLADPPWRYDHQQAGNREIENHYETQTLETIKQHAPPSTPDCVLLLWATAPKLEEALEVVRAWGFTYKTHAVWDKEKIGMGYWFRGQHELLLVGTKGSPGTVPEPARVSSVFREKRGQHSAKPVAVYEWIEYAFPDLSKLEMYARKPRPGWAVWGNEV